MANLAEAHIVPRFNGLINVVVVLNRSQPFNCDDRPVMSSTYIRSKWACITGFTGTIK